jgi:superfamily II DNA or RNA helicase
MGDDILIEACFGKQIANINASFLIRRKQLVRPEIFFLKIKKDQNIAYKSYNKIYDSCIVHNEVRNRWISEIAIKMHSSGRLPLILVKRVEHGEILEGMIPNSTFVYGQTDIKKRKQYLNRMRDSDCGITIATVIFDEGVNVPPLDTLILAGSGKSSTRALQRIGRTLRPCAGKEDAIIIDFDDQHKYLKDHSKRRRKIYSTEPEFIIRNMEP